MAVKIIFELYALITKTDALNYSVVQLRGKLTATWNSQPNAFL